MILRVSPFVLFRWEIADDWPVSYVSENVRQFGYEPDAFTSGQILWPGIVHPDDRERLREEVENYLERGGQHFSKQYRLLTAAGGVRWIQDWNHVILEDGRPKQIQGLLQDITDRIEAEREIERLQRALASRPTATTADILPICMHCKELRDVAGRWQAPEKYFAKRFGLQFSHGLCPDCLQKHYAP